MTRAPTYAPLSPMQQTCALLMGAGLGYKEAGGLLLIQPNTVKYHVEEAAKKIASDLPARTRVALWARGASQDVLDGSRLRAADHPLARA